MSQVASHLASAAAARASGSERQTPLVLDLDGTLIRTDILYETLLILMKQQPWRLPQLVWWALCGRAHLKQRLTGCVFLNVDTLPVNEAVVDYAAAEAENGRPVALATATDALTAHRVARRFPFIGKVHATEGAVNLKGKVKASLLKQQYPDGFAYAGDGVADLNVWKEADSAILVEPAPGLAGRAAGLTRIERVFPSTSSTKLVLKALRAHQWAKNLLVFVPLVLDGMVLNASAWTTAAIAFVSLSFLASATYLFNDLWDLQEDRQHWTKRNRPLASGRLTIAAAGRLMLSLGVIAIGLTAFLPAAATAVLFVYLALTLSYSFYFKRQPIFDTMTLAALFTLRLGLGMAATGAESSTWLLVFSMFLFSSLTLAKRHTEIARSIDRGHETAPGRGYGAADAMLVQMLGVATGIGAVLIMVLYLIEDAFHLAFYSAHEFLWALPIVLFLWVSRVWLISSRGELDDDPVVFALRDNTSRFYAVVLGICFLIAAHGLPI